MKAVYFVFLIPLLNVMLLVSSNFKHFYFLSFSVMQSVLNQNERKKRHILKTGKHGIGGETTRNTSKISQIDKSLPSLFISTGSNCFSFF